jgi:uncharacterized protein (TIGR03083 family)
MDRTAIAAAVRTERHDLCDFLADLDDAEWTTPSLCPAWTVREVVAHLTIPTRATVGFVARAAFRARGDFDRMNVDIARDRAARYPPAELVQQLRQSAESSRRMPGSGPMDPLMDLLVHGQDIARPLDRRRPVRPDVAVPVLTYVAGNRLLGAPERLRGLRLVADDVSWSAGEGPQVRGDAADLLLVAAGRPAGLAGVTGPGVGRLAERLGSR